ncbi:hypothetical protein HYV43_05305 [Candidatus Micrarchaeota archaeon]|nr:hypothetical protein [Candidatus Micrarchaeota archaeon]
MTQIKTYHPTAAIQKKSAVGKTCPERPERERKRQIGELEKEGVLKKKAVDKKALKTTSK